MNSLLIYKKYRNVSKKKKEILFKYILLNKKVSLNVINYPTDCQITLIRITQSSIIYFFLFEHKLDEKTII